jgi:hypothetical protein
MSKRFSRWHLFEELSDLAELVRGVEAVPVALRCALSDISPRDSVAKLADLREQFYALPEAAQRAALRGWRPAPVRLPRERILEIQAENPVLRVMELSCAHYSSDRPVESQHRFPIGEWCGEAVCVTVREGAALQDVLFELSRIFHFVKANWPKLIDDDRDLHLAACIAAELSPGGDEGEKEVPLAAARGRVLGPMSEQVDGLIAV